MPLPFDDFNNPDVTFGVVEHDSFKFQLDPEFHRHFIENKKKIELLLNGGAVLFTPDKSNLFDTGILRRSEFDANHYLTLRDAFLPSNPVTPLPEPRLSEGREWLRENANFQRRVIVGADGERTVIPADQTAPDTTKSAEVLALVWPSAGAAPVTAPNADIQVPGQVPSRAPEAIGEILGVSPRPLGQTIGNMIPFHARPNAAGTVHLQHFSSTNPEAIEILRLLPPEGQRAALSDIADYVFSLPPTGFDLLDLPTQRLLFEANLLSIINLHRARFSHAVNSETSPGRPGDPGQPAGSNLPLQDLMRRVAEGWVPPATQPGAPAASGDTGPGQWQYVPEDPLDRDPEWRAARDALLEQIRRMEAARNEPEAILQFPELPFQRYSRLMDQIGQIAGPQFLDQWRQFSDRFVGLNTQMSFYTEGMSAETLMTYMQLLMKGVPEHVVFGVMRGDDPNEVIRWFDNRHPTATLEPSERREEAQQEIERRLSDPKSPFDNGDWRRYQRAFPDIAEELYRLAAQGADPADVADAVEQLLRGFAAAHDILFALRNSGAGGERGGPPGGGGLGTVAGAPDDPGAGSSLSEQTRAAIDALRNTDLEAFVREYSESQRLAPRPGAPDVSDRINPNLLRPFFDIEAFIGSDAGAVEAPGLNRLLEGLEGQYDTPETLTRLLIQSMIDPITGLPNINAAALYLNPNDDAAALSLGGLKYINTYSHILGDGYIASIGRFLAQQIRDFMPEAFGDTVNLFYSSGTDFVLTGPPDLLPHVIARLHDVFSSQPWFGISENEETGLVNPGMVSNMFRLDRLWQDVQAAGGDLDTLRQIFEDSYRGARELLDELKPGAENYPARGEDLLQRVEDPENFVGILPVIPDLIPPSPGSSRWDATQQLRERFDQLRAELEGLPQELFEKFRNGLLTQLFTNPRYPQLLNNRVEFSLPRDEQGNIVPGYGVLSGDVATLGGLNNVSWDAGDLVIAHYERTMAEIALLFPDLTILKIGGDEATMYGPMEALEAARDYLQQAMASARIMFPNPENPQEMLTIEGLSAQVGILPFSEDGTPPDPEALEDQVLQNKIDQQFRLRILREDNSVFYEGPPPPQSDATPSP